MFQIVAVEVLPDGSVDLITPQIAKDMRLPFNRGWDRWAVMQNDRRIFTSKSFSLVESTASALSHSKH